LPGYIPYFANRQDSYGGVAISVNEKISSTLVLEEEFQKSNILIVKLS